MITNCTSSGVPRIAQIYTPAHHLTAPSRERRISATTRPTRMARIIATTEITMVNTSPFKNGALGVNRLFQKNCQSKFIAHLLRSLVDAEIGLAPLRQHLVVCAIGDDFVEALLNRVV